MAEPDAAPGPDSWEGHSLDDMQGNRVGKVAGVIGGAGGEPGWLLAKVGRLGQVTAVPAADAVEGAGSVWVPYPRELIRKAPRVEQQGELDAAAERGLREHYGVG